jgi:hypothetical protein
MLPIIALLVFITIQIFFINDKNSPWWTPIIYGAAYMIFVLASGWRYMMWRSTNKKKYTEM